MDVSIILTTYNYEKYIAESLNSCLEQKTKLDFEVIVINDGSTDSTANILSGFNNSKLIVSSISNSGIEVAANHGFSLASGKFVVRVDADDKLSSGFIDSFAPYLIMDSEYDFFYSGYYVFDELSNITKEVVLPPFSEDEIFKRGDFLATGTIFKKSVIDFLGGYSVTNRNSGLENYELILRLLSNGRKGYYLNKSLFFYRRHQRNLSVTDIERIIENGKNLFKENKYGLFCTNKYHPYDLKLN